MNRIFAAFGMAALGIGAPAAAQGGSAEIGERLGACLIAKSTGADRIAVARWMVAALASAPQAQDVATPRAGAKAAADRAMAALFTRLMVTECAAESKALFASGGMQAGFRVAGGALGRVAMEELLRDPKAAQALADYAELLREQDFAPVLPRK